MIRRVTKRFYVPALGIISAVILLMVLLGYYAYSNYRHERNLMVAFLNREAQMAIRALEAGTRTGMLGSTWKNGQLSRLLEETARNPAVIYLRVLDQEGRLLMASGRRDNLDAGEVLHRLDKEDVVTWMEDGGKVFVMAELFDPFRGHGQALVGHEMMMRRWQDWCRTMRVPPESTRQVVVVGLSTKDFLQAQQEDLRRAVGTGVVLLLLGGAAFYFLFVVQNTYAVNRALSQTKSYAQNVVESISNGVFSVDRQGRVVSINGIACKMLGVATEEAIGQYYYDLISEGTCRFEPTIEKGERILEKEVVCFSCSGKKVEASVSTSQLKDDEGKVLGAVVVLRDLKTIRKLEGQLRRSERLASMGQMVAGVAHELRNPLSSIKGFARFFLRRFDDSTEEGQCSELLVREVDRLNRVITNLLTFGQPMQLKYTAVDIKDVIEHALLLCEPEIREKTIAVEQNLSPDLKIQADRDLLIQVLVNLFRNGVESMAANGQLTISADLHEQGVEIRVSDTGCGISEEDRSRIFDPFFTTKQGGTGLGLPIVHSIIETHKGQIHVDSQHGEGTTFRIELPARG